MQEFPQLNKYRFKKHSIDKIFVVMHIKLFIHCFKHTGATTLQKLGGLNTGEARIKACEVHKKRFEGEAMNRFLKPEESAGDWRYCVKGGK